MNQMKKILSIILMAVMGVANAQSNSIGPSLESASSFLSLPKLYQMGYVEGVVDGVMASPLLGNDYKRIEMLRNCIFTMDNDAKLSVVISYIKTHKKIHEAPINMVVVIAISNICSSKGFNLKGAK